MRRGGAPSDGVVLIQVSADNRSPNGFFRSL
jgi:hypothetical protein